MKRRRRAGVVVMAALLLLLPGCVEEMKGSFLDDEPINRGTETKKLFIPRSDELVKDEETGLTIVVNVINITFHKKTDRGRIDTIIASVDGRIVGYDIPGALYQIRFADHQLPAIDAIRRRLLSEFREVEVASRFFVSVHKDPYYAK